LEARKAGLREKVNKHSKGTMIMTTESNLEPKSNLLRRFPLVSFFVLSYLFFLIAILIIGAVVSLTSVSVIFMGLLIAFASWTPNLAAVVVTAVTKGKTEAKRLFTGWLKRPVNHWWYLFGFTPILIAFVSVGLFAILGDVSVPEVTTELNTSTFALMIFFHIIQGATGEELGWRGFALPGLQKRFSPLVSAIILGLIVSGWHGLLHLVSPTGIPEWQFWLLMISYSVIVTWAYNKSKGSVLIAILFHFAFNFSLELVSTRLGLVPLESLFAIRTCIYSILAGILILTSEMNSPIEN
jgi:membrane protease YdiL (CAAX protease family)